MDPRVVPRRPRGSADPVPPAQRAAGATPSPQLGARLSARKGSTSERCSARARCCTVLTAMSTASRPLAVQLGEFVAGLRFENLPSAVVDKAKAVVNHAVTVGMAGFGTERAGAARQAVLSQERLGTRRVGAGQGATLWVEGTRVTRVGAGFANGVAVAVNNQCDSYHMLTHPGVLIVPAGLATAEGEGRTGRELLTALVAGYEVQCRCARDFICVVTFCTRRWRSEEHTSELQSQSNLVCRLLLEKKKKTKKNVHH